MHNHFNTIQDNQTNTTVHKDYTKILQLLVNNHSIQHQSFSPKLKFPTNNQQTQPVIKKIQNKPHSNSLFPYIQKLTNASSYHLQKQHNNQIYPQSKVIQAIQYQINQQNNSNLLTIFQRRKETEKKKHIKKLNDIIFNKFNGSIILEGNTLANHPQQYQSKQFDSTKYQKKNQLLLKELINQKVKNLKPLTKINNKMKQSVVLSDNRNQYRQKSNKICKFSQNIESLTSLRNNTSMQPLFPTLNIQIECDSSKQQFLRQSLQKKYKSNNENLLGVFKLKDHEKSFLNEDINSWEIQSSKSYIS